MLFLDYIKNEMNRTKKVRTIKKFRKNIEDDFMINSEIIELSNKIKSKLNLSKKELDYFEDKSYIMEFKSCNIRCVSRPFSNWEKILEVIPSHIKEDVWEIDADEIIPYGWIYKFRGTNTICMPPEDVIEKLLLEIE